MDFDLSEVPEPVRQFIKDALQERRNALIGCEREIKQALQESVKRIQKELKGGRLGGIDEHIRHVLENEKVNFAAKLDAITEKALIEASIAGLSIGERIKRAYNASAAGVKFKLIEKDIVREAELIAQSTMRKKRVFKNKPFVLSDKIWDISGNNLDKIKDIIESGVNTDARKVAEALACYVKKGAENFVNDYPALAERMGGNLPKDLVYEALRLARNELSETYWLATIEGYKDNPAIKAVKWLLSNNRIPGYHDVCDELAYADDYGLGCGIYPLDDAPMKPHICCLCCLAPVILKDIEKGIGNTPPENWDEVKERLKNGHGFINMNELTEEQKEKLREQRRQAYQRRKEKKEAEAAEKLKKQNIETPMTKPVAMPKADPIENIQTFDWFKDGIKTEDKEVFLEDLKKVDKKYLDIMSKHCGDMKVDLYSKKISCYHPIEKKIYVNIKDDNKENVVAGFKQNTTTFLHETGHWLDYNALAETKIRKELPDLKKYLEADALNYTNVILKSNGLKELKNFDRISKEAKDCIHNVFTTDKAIYSNVTDIIGGITSNRLCGQDNGFYGHPKNYWKYKGILETEAVAEFFESTCSGGKRLDVIKRTFPTAYDYFIKFIGEKL